MSVGLVILLSLAVAAFTQDRETSIAWRGKVSYTGIPSLLSKATKQIDLTTHGNLVSDQPWLTDQAVIINKGETFFRYDLAAKTSQPLTALTDQCNAASDYGVSMHCSSNGQQILWTASGTDFVVSDIQASLEHRWHSTSPLSSAQWCADGRHWAELQFAGSGAPSNTHIHWTRIFIHDADHPNANRFFPLPAALKRLEILSVISPNQVITRTPDAETVKPVVFAPKGRGTNFLISHTRRSTQQINVWSLTQGRMLQHWTIHLPGVATRVVVSPQGNRIAWLLETSAQGHAMKFNMVRETVWVSGLDGHGMHLIGTFTKTVPPTNVSARDNLLLKGDKSFTSVATKFSVLAMPAEVQWLPSGKKLSFVYQGTLWTVPVN